MRILHIITRFIKGGADENTLLTCNAQAQLGHQVFLIVGRERDPTMLSLVDSKVEVLKEDTLVREISLYHDSMCLVALWKLVQAIKPDVVHTHESKAGVIGRLAARGACDAKIVHTVHILPYVGVGRLKRMVFTVFERIAGLVTDSYIHVSKGMLDECRTAGVGQRATHTVVRSGMDLDSFTGACPVDWRQDRSTRNIKIANPKFLLCTGMFERRKRIVELVWTFRDVAKACPDAVLLIAGDGMLRSEVNEAIGEAHLEGRVVLLGHRSDLAGWIALADACVHVASQEGLPRVIIQYAAARKPIVACNLPGLEEVVVHEQNGFVVHSQRPEDVAQYIIRLLRDPELRQKFRSGSSQLDLSEWRVSSMVEKVMNVYRSSCT